MKKLILLGVLVVILSSLNLFAAGRGKLFFAHDVEKDKWPLITNFARVYCKDLGFGAKAVYLSTILTTPPGKKIITDVYEYAVNGTARGAMKKLRLKAIAPIMKKGKVPGDLQLFIEAGLKECN